MYLCLTQRNLQTGFMLTPASQAGFLSAESIGEFQR
jgi:hypothetical protein